MANVKFKNGDMVNLSNGEVAKVVRIKKTRFIGEINGMDFDISFNMVKSIVGQEKESEKGKEIDFKDIPQLKSDLKELKKGDFFYIPKETRGKTNCLLFIFDEIKPSGKVVGTNPYTNGKVTIDKNFIFKKVK